MFGTRVAEKNKFLYENLKIRNNTIVYTYLTF